jgi:hypothetical protein
VRDVLYMIRFFSIVAPVPRLMVQSMVAAGVFAVVVTHVDEARSARALTPLLLLQLFAASSGFLVPARRGHYDLLLTGGYRRASVAGMHWAASMLPGVAVWLTVVAVTVVAVPSAATAMLATGTLVTLTLVSTVPWAATIALPRFTASIAWLVLVAVAAAILPSQQGLPLDPSQRADAPAPAAIGIAAIGIALNPLALIGLDFTRAQSLIVISPIVLSVGSMIGALVWTERRNVPLEAAQ